MDETGAASNLKVYLVSCSALPQQPYVSPYVQLSRCSSFSAPSDCFELHATTPSTVEQERGVQRRTQVLATPTCAPHRVPPSTFTTDTSHTLGMC